VQNLVEFRFCRLVMAAARLMAPQHSAPKRFRYPSVLDGAQISVQWGFARASNR
jgi:hypothetical protein